MAIVPFLAMTAAEIAAEREFPEKTAWMACHFSPYGPGLSNLPRRLPPGSLLVVDDATPIRNHDPEIILGQLRTCVDNLACRGILLDFQRPVEERTSSLADYLSANLPCPVAVSHFYAGNASPVFLPPVPPSVAPEDYFVPWQGREIWLEFAMDGEEITVTESGASFLSLPCVTPLETDFFDETLLCHYRQEVREEEIKFTLHRTAADVTWLLQEAKKYGVTTAVGLYQEFVMHQR